MVATQEGKLRALAVTGAKRSPQLPDVATVIESGVPGYEASSGWDPRPKGTPAPIIDQSLRELMQVLRPMNENLHGERQHRNRRFDARRVRAFFRSEKELWAKSSGKPAPRSISAKYDRQHR